MNAFLFDLDDTLYARITPFLYAFHKVFPDTPLEDPDGAYRIFLARGHDRFHAAMSGQIPMSEMYIYRIRRTCEALGRQVTDEEGLAFHAAYTDSLHVIQLSDEIRGMLDKLTEHGNFTGIVTNGTSSHQRLKYKSLGLARWIPEDRFLASGDIDISKPDPRILEEALRRWKLSPEETYYVGDNFVYDIECAQAAGLPSIWFDRLGLSEDPDFGIPSLTAAVARDEKGMCDVILQKAEA